MVRKYILSIDGGGVRGILATQALVALEKTTGKRARDIFSLAAGTSTGAIIAASVAAGIPATKILDIYCSRGKELFRKHFYSVLQRIFFGYMYDNRILYKILVEELGPAAKWQLNESPIDILIPAKRLVDGMPFYFVKDQDKNACTTGCLNIIDCVVASAAAPTYFKPWVIIEAKNDATGSKLPIGKLVDGGVGVAGNPVYQSAVEAFYYTNHFDPSDTTIVSLGTGRFADRADPMWIWDWLAWLLEELFRSPGEQQTELVHRHFSQTTFYRLDPNLKALDPKITKDIPLDAADKLELLCQLGERFASMINWQAVLDGTDKEFLVTPGKTQWYQYKRP